MTLPEISRTVGCAGGAAAARTVMPRCALLSSLPISAVMVISPAFDWPAATWPAVSWAVKSTDWPNGISWVTSH